MEGHSERTRLLAYIPKTITEMSSVVYFLQGSKGFIKIGFSTRLTKRVSSIMRSSVEGMALVGVMLGNIDLERRLHRRFEEYRWNGEWFCPADELVRYINENRDPKVKRIIETIRDVGPGWKEAFAEIVDLHDPVRADDLTESFEFPIMIPEGHPGDNYDYRMGTYSDRGDHGQGGNDIWL